MKKRVIWFLLILLLLPCLPVMAEEGVEVGLCIEDDTTWTAEGGPYVLTGNTLVPEGVTLTITAGAVVQSKWHGNRFYVQVEGRLIVVGEPEKQVNAQEAEFRLVSDNNCISYADIGEIMLLSSHNEIVDSACDSIQFGDEWKNYEGNRSYNTIERCHLKEMVLNQACHNEILYNTFELSMQRYCLTLRDGSDSNLIRGNQFYESGVFINNSEDNTITECDFLVCAIGVDVMVEPNPTLERTNRILQNDFRAGKDAGYFIQLQDVRETPPIIKRNNFYVDYDMMFALRFLDTDGTIDMTENYWGSTDPEQIASAFISRNNGFPNEAFAEFEPFLVAPYGIDQVSASQPTGRYAYPIQVALSAADGAEIYYTIDGSDPTGASGIRYTEELTFRTTVRLKAVAKKDGVFGMVTEYLYTITEPQPSYEIGVLSLTSMDGTALPNIPEQGTFLVSVPVTKKDFSSTKPHLILAVYDQSGAYIDFSYLSGTFHKGQTVTFGVMERQRQDTKIARIRAFVWDGLLSMHPLSNVVTYE